MAKVASVIDRAIKVCPKSAPWILQGHEIWSGYMAELHALHRIGGKHTAEVLRRAQGWSIEKFRKDGIRLDDHMIEFEKQWDTGERPPRYAIPTFDIQWAFLVGYDLSKFVAFVQNKVTTTKEATRLRDYKKIQTLLYVYGFLDDTPHDPCIVPTDLTRGLFVDANLLRKVEDECHKAYARTALD